MMQKKSTYYIDSHAHLQSEKVSEAALTEWIKESNSQGIQHWILGGVDPNDWNRQIDLKKKFPEYFSMSFGLHPWWVASQSAADCEVAFDDLERRFAPDSETAPIALGELGLDFHERFSDSTHAVQIEFFERQLSLGEKLSVPIVLHIVQAHPRALTLLEARGVTHGGIVHSFSGDVETARRYLSLGLTPSISAAVLSRGSGKAFDTLRRTVLSLGPNEFVLETDSPDQPPASEKGQPNRPVNLISIARWVSEIRGEAFDAVLERSTETVKKIFELKV